MPNAQNCGMYGPVVTSKVQVKFGPNAYGADTGHKGFFYGGCPFLAEFKKEAAMHNYEIKDKVLTLAPRDKVKERLGHSPDIFDAVITGYGRYLAANGARR